MKAKIPFERRNPSGAAASKAEILRQIVETNAEYELENDALFLWVLHEKYGFGLGRLRGLYEEVFRARKEMHDFLRASPEDNPRRDPKRLENENRRTTYFAFTKKLRDYGLDIGAEFDRLDGKYGLK